MKLYEEFKEYENLWEDTSVRKPSVVESREDRIKRLQNKRNKLAFKQAVLESQTSSVIAEVEGTSKRIAHNGLLHKKALRKLIDFINTLTDEEKLNLYFHWGMDYEVGDCEGDPILNKDSGDMTVYDNTSTSPVPEDAYDKVAVALGIN